MAGSTFAARDAGNSEAATATASNPAVAGGVHVAELPASLGLGALARQPLPHQLVGVSREVKPQLLVHFALHGRAAIPAPEQVEQ